MSDKQIVAEMVEESNRILEAENEVLRAKLALALHKLGNKGTGKRGKAPVIRNQVVEFLRDTKGAPNHSVAVSILAKYFCPKKKGEEKAAWEARVAELAAEMSK